MRAVVSGAISCTSTNVIIVSSPSVSVSSSCRHPAPPASTDCLLTVYLTVLLILLAPAAPRPPRPRRLYRNGCS